MNLRRMNKYYGWNGYVFVMLLIGAGTIGLSHKVHAQSNVQTFTPSVLLKSGQVDINFFNNIYTQTSIRNAEGNKVDLGERQSFLNTSLSFLYGLKNVNIGLEVNLNRAHYTSSNSSVLSIFGNAESFSRNVVSAIGPRVKFAPFSSFKGFSFQSTILFPVASDLESPRFIAHDRISWFNQLFLDRSIGPRTRLFTEIALIYRIKNNSSQQNFLRVPVSIVFSYFPTKNSTLFLLGQHAPAFGNLQGMSESVFGQLRWYTLISAGTKYQLTKSLGLELSYGNFVLSRADGAGSVINFGLRLIH